MGERALQPDVWQLPQGGIEQDCSLEENALREASEELGAPKALFKIITKLNATNQYEFDIVPKFLKGKFRGQDQSFCVLRFLGDDQNINLNLHHPEFKRFKWCSLKEVLELAEPKRVKGYEKALKELLSLSSISIAV